MTVIVEGAAGEVRIDRSLLRGLSDVVAGRLREFEARRPLSPARFGDDWGFKFDGNGVEVSAKFEAYTPEGAVFLGELGSAGFFDSLTGIG